MESLYKLKIFSGLEKENIDLIIDNSEKKQFKKDEIIFIQGEENDGNAYIITKGSVGVNIFNKEVAILGIGEIFGEIALLNDELRTATIKANEDIETIIINIDTLFEIINENPNINKDIMKRIESNLLVK